MNCVAICWERVARDSPTSYSVFVGSLGTPKKQKSKKAKKQKSKRAKEQKSKRAKEQKSKRAKEKLRVGERLLFFGCVFNQTIICR